MVSESVRSVISFAIFVHFFCVLVVFGSSYSPSELQQRLVQVLSPYTTSLHLDPNHASYQLLPPRESASPVHQWIVGGANGKELRFPGHQWSGGFPYQRWESMARIVSNYALAEMDEVPAEFAKGLATQLLRGATDKTPIWVRIERTELGTSSLPSERPVTLPYEADVWLGSDGQLHVLRRSPKALTSLPNSDGRSALPNEAN